jgi:ribonuclease HII
MVTEAGRFPDYGFQAHKGYPTPEHLAALDRHGLCPLHRRSFITIRTRAELEAQALANTARD